MNSHFSNFDRPNKDRTRAEERLVEAAKDLFFRHGVKRITVEEICGQAQVSKMTFYRHFPDKTAMALRVLKDIVSLRQRRMREIEMQDLPFDAKLRQTFDLLLQQSRAHGPEFFSGFLKGADPALERFIEDERNRSLQQVRTLFVTAQRLGEVRKDVKVDLILHMLDAARAALSSEHLTGLYPDAPALAREALSLFLEGTLRR